MVYDVLAPGYPEINLVDLQQAANALGNTSEDVDGIV